MLFLVISELDTKKNLDLMFKSNKSILKHIMYKLIANHRLPISETKNKTKEKLFGDFVVYPFGCSYMVHFYHASHKNH